MQKKVSKTIKLPKGTTKNLQDQYPNPGQQENVLQATMQENNHFKTFEPEEIRVRYMRFSVFMEALNNNLDLDRSATVEQFARRISDLVQAAATV